MIKKGSIAGCGLGRKELVNGYKWNDNLWSFGWFEK
jgi:ribosomal protein L37E